MERAGQEWGRGWELWYENKQDKFRHWLVPLGVFGIRSKGLSELVRVMEMALWSPIISLPFPIMYLSLCPIDCTHWMLSLNRYFPEEKWFVYEQTLPLLSMTAAASLKWIRMRTGWRPRCAEQEIYFPLARSLLLGLHLLLFPNRTAWHEYMGYRAQYCLTLTYSSPLYQGWKQFQSHYIAQCEILSGRPFLLYSWRTKTNFEVPHCCDSKRQCGNLMCYMHPTILIIPLLLGYHV